MSLGHCKGSVISKDAIAHAMRCVCGAVWIWRASRVSDGLGNLAWERNVGGV